MVGKIIAASLLILLAGFFQAAMAGLRLEVEIAGVQGELKKNVLSFLSIERQRKAPEFDEAFMKDLFDRAPGEIRTALQPFGFYTPEISSELVKKDDTWHAVFHITPGEPARVTKLHLEISGEGAEKPPFKGFKESFPLKVGGVLNEQAYEDAKRNLQDYAANYGFLNATMPEHRIQVYPGRHAAEVFLTFDTGPRFRFGEVTFIQNTLSPAFLERFVHFKKGDPFNTTVLLDLQSALNASGYFSQVLVNTVRKKAAGLEVPVEITLTPAKRYQLSIGGGYGTNTGPRGRINWTDRWLNMEGHKMEVDLRIAQFAQNAIWRYTVPLKDPARSHMDYTLGYVAEQTDVESYETYEAGPSYTRVLSSHWIETIYFNVERVHFSVAGESATDTLLLPTATWTYKKQPEEIYVNGGFGLIATLTGTAKSMLSSISFVQARLQPKYVRGIGGFGSLILRGDFGATEVDNFQRLPASLRFFAGGDDSVRGYSYKGLGPTNALGVVGGNFLSVASIEYDQKVYGKWGAAVFYDGGNAFSSFPPTWLSGAGVGVRWASPIGPVRLDFAWALSEPSHTFHIYVSVGPEI